MSWQSTSRYGSRRLLQSHFLVIPVHCLLRVDREWSSTLTVRTEANLELFGCVLEERTERRATFSAIKLDVFELREDTRSASDHSGDLDETVEVALSQVSQRERRREFGDSDVDFRVDSVV